MQQRTSVGLDVHARSIVACAIDAETGQVWRQRFGTETAPVAQWILGLPGPQAAVYEAGPTGFGLARFLGEAGIPTAVAASSKLQRPAGDRVKTDARDALHLAKLLKLGEIVAVAIPTVEAEAARDLVRARDDARSDLMSARHRLSKLLLRNGIVFEGKQTWTKAHEQWLRTQRFDLPARQIAYEVSFEAMTSCRDRRDRLDAAILRLAADSEFSEVTRRLACVRGISTLTAFSLTVEIGDWNRLSGRSIGSYVGLTTSETSTGGSRHQGGITKTGNGHVRRLLVEAAWHHRRDYRSSSPIMRERWAQASPAAAARGHQANLRLHRRWVAFDARGKRPVVANTAIARELAGFCWSLATLE